MLDNIQIIGKVTLEDLRRMTGLNQKEFAEKVEIPFTTYRRYERDTANMEVGRLFRLCDIIGVSVANIRL